MCQRSISAAIFAGFILFGAEPVLAQQPRLQADPRLNAEDQLAPSQIMQPMPAAVEQPGAANARAVAPVRHAVARTREPRPAAAAPRLAASRVIACSGPFAKDSGNLALAMTFDSKNVVFTTVDGGPAGRVQVSVLFPKDPKLRLEVWWSDPASRTNIDLIDINGQSTWTAPGGLRLGLTLPELERLNHKPFKLKGFDKDNVATVSDWDGGALAAFPGGCKAGVSLSADPRASADAMSAVSDNNEFSSDAPAMREVKPTISEILIGY
jgi:hypothetical protein